MPRWALVALLVSCGETPATPGAAGSPPPSADPAGPPPASSETVEMVAPTRAEGAAAPSTSPAVPIAPDHAGSPAGAAPTTGGSSAPDPSVLVAARAVGPIAIDGSLDEPTWGSAPSIALATNWRGDAFVALATHARLAWQPDALFVAFDGTFEGEIDAPDEAPEVEAEHLYAHDALEIFVDPDPTTPETYLEIELGPCGHHLDVSVDRSRRPRGDVAWSSGLEARSVVDPTARTFVIEARIPASALGGELAPHDLRANVFRIGRTAGERIFLARFPTMAERANFHVPERFGILRLAR